MTSPGPSGTDAVPVPPEGARIGILGGSFNPAHDGHRHISDQALDLLGLDKVWWLVSPQNPLKSAEGMAPFAQRMASCLSVIGARADIVATDLEVRLGTWRTVETIGKVCERYAGRHFVWMMGADNLIQIACWSAWQEIFKTVPVAVFARPTYGAHALASKAARMFSADRVVAGDARALATMPPPAWVYLDIALHPGSATEIRSRQIT